MDNEPYTQESREDDSPRDALSTNLGLARITSAPEALRPSRGEPRPQLYLFSKSPDALRNPRFAGERLPTALPPLDTVAERPEKRPRLDYDLDTAHGRTFKRGAFLEKPSSSYAGPRASHLQSAVSPRSSDVSEHEQETGSPCSRCWATEDLASRVVMGVQELHLELSKALPLNSRVFPRSHEAVLHNMTKQGLREPLEWTLSEIRAILRAVQGVSATTRPGLPSLADVVPERDLAEVRGPSTPSQTSTRATAAGEARPPSFPSDQPHPDEYSRKPQDQGRDSYLSSREAALPPMLSPDEIKRSHTYEQISASSAYPHGPGGFIPQSPMQNQRHDRTLPSPPSAQYHSPGFSGPSQFSPVTQAAHASHLQDLQHQISTKTLALQTLQREHDQLLAAFSRSQIRCNTLDKKSQVSDHEINSLTEEKLRLQQQVEQLEAQVEELAKTRDEMNQQSSADGAQWRQIMAMSSQLQIQGAEQAKKYKADREAWETDRQAMEQQLRDLDTGRGSPAGKQRAPETGMEDDALKAASMETMRQEIIRLRQKCTGLEDMLQEVSGETEEIDHAINAMANIRQRIAGKKTEDNKS